MAKKAVAAYSVWYALYKLPVYSICHREIDILKERYNYEKNCIYCINITDDYSNYRNNMYLCQGTYGSYFGDTFNIIGGKFVERYCNVDLC